VAKISASRQFKRVFPILEKEFGRRERFRSHPPVEQALVTALLKDGKEDAAKRALKRLDRDFVDLNEVRVSVPEELDETLGRGYPPGTGAVVTRTLTAIFNRAQAMNLDGILELDSQKARKKLFRLKPMPSRVAGELLFTQFGYSKLPRGAGLLRVARRTRITNKGNTDSQMSTLRRIVPAAAAVRVFHAFETLAERICTETDYACRACPIHEYCPTGIDTVKRLDAKEAKEREAQEAEEKRQKEQRVRDRRVRARKRVATAKLKKAIAARSKQLKISPRKTTKRRRKPAPRPANTKMVQASSAEVKPERKKKKRRPTKSKRQAAKNT
jgi:endonuclease III